jgi:hypothetical protein
MGRLAGTLALAVLIVVSTLAGPARATMLRVTEGEVTLLPLDTLAAFSGRGFSVLGSSPFGLDIGALFGHGAATVSVAFPVGDVGGLFLEVGEASCVSPEPDCSLSMTFKSHKLKPAPAHWPLDVNYTATAPFRARGHLAMGEGFDIVGHGSMTAIICRDFSEGPCAFGGGSVVIYTFGAHGADADRRLGLASIDGARSLPEASVLTLVLLAAALAGIVLGSRRTRSRVP